MDTATAAPPTENSAPAQTAPAVTPSAGATETSANTGQTTQPTPVEKLSIMGVDIEKSKVPPELLGKVDSWNKAYTETTQKLSAAEKKAQALDQLSNHQGFQKWYWEQMNGGAKPEVKKEDPYNLTPETQAELLSDPAKMRSYIEGLTKSVIDQYALPAANEARREAQTLRNEQTIEHLAEKYKDFDNLTDKISEVIGKYYQKNGVDIDLEDAYWLAKRPFMESEAEIKAHQRVEEKVNGSTLPPSGAPPAGVKMISGKGMSFEEKMRVAAEHAFRGEKVKFDS